MVEHTGTLGFWVAFLLGVRTVIDAGIFSLSGTALAEVESSAVRPFVIAAMVNAASPAEFIAEEGPNTGRRRPPRRPICRRPTKHAGEAPGETAIPREK